MPAILGANSDTGAYQIDNGLRFNSGNSALHFTPSSDGNEQTWTVSFWVKRSLTGTSSSQMIFCSDTNYDEYVFCRFCGTEVTDKTDMFQVFMVEPNAREGNVRTARLFRDPAAWNHIVVRCDLTQSTAADRLRIYVNGTKETVFDTASYLNQNDDNINWNSNVPQAIGSQKQASTIERPLHGYLAEFYNIEGSSLGPDSFGETNDNGVWVPIKYSGSYGSNGYKLEFQQTGTSQNSSGIGADTSGNDNHFDVASTLVANDVVTDTPTNNFTTMNSLYHDTTSGYYTQYTHGNLRSPTTTSGNSALTWNLTTQGANNGKWYAEGKVEYASSTAGTAGFGIVNLDNVQNGKFNEITNLGIYYAVNGALYLNNGSSGSYGTYTTNDVIGVFMNLDDRELRFSKNGTMLNSSNSFVTIPSGTYGFSFLDNSGHGYDFAWNFGNPKYNLSSAVNDSNGHGSFEYSPNDGTDNYFALCTKNLAEYG